MSYQHLIDQLYAMLGRKADAGGQAHWLSRLPEMQGGDTTQLTPLTLQTFSNAANEHPTDQASLTRHLSAPTMNKFTPGAAQFYNNSHAKAQAQAQAINNMPGVWNYNSSPVMGDEQAQAAYKGLMGRFGGLGGLGGLNEQ